MVGSQFLADSPTWKKAFIQKCIKRVRTDRAALLRKRRSARSRGDAEDEEDRHVRAGHDDANPSPPGPSHSMLASIIRDEWGAVTAKDTSGAWRVVRGGFMDESNHGSQEFAIGGGDDMPVDVDLRGPPPNLGPSGLRPEHIPDELSSEEHAEVRSVRLVCLVCFVLICCCCVCRGAFVGVAGFGTDVTECLGLNIENLLPESFPFAGWG